MKLFTVLTVCENVNEVDLHNRQDSVTLNNTILNIPVNADNVPSQEIASINNKSSVKTISHSKAAYHPPKFFYKKRQTYH